VKYLFEFVTHPSNALRLRRHSCIADLTACLGLLPRAVNALKSFGFFSYLSNYVTMAVGGIITILQPISNLYDGWNCQRCWINDWKISNSFYKNGDRARKYML